MTIVMCSCVQGQNGYDYTLKGPGLNGYNEMGITPMIFEILDDEGKLYNTYCADSYTKILNGSEYKYLSIDVSERFSMEAVGHLVAIMYNSYPYISIDELEERSGINYIKKKEAVTAVQYAIWHYTNNQDLISGYDVVNDLYYWLINLPVMKNGDFENDMGKIYLAVNDDINTQMLIGIGSAKRTETTIGITEGGESEVSTTGENTTEANTTGENTTEASTTKVNVTEENTTNVNSTEANTIERSISENVGSSKHIVDKVPATGDKSEKTADLLIIAIIEGIVITIFLSRMKV